MGKGGSLSGIASGGSPQRRAICECMNTVDGVRSTQYISRRSRRGAWAGAICIVRKPVFSLWYFMAWWPRWLAKFVSSSVGGWIRGCTPGTPENLCKGPPKACSSCVTMRRNRRPRLVRWLPSFRLRTLSPRATLVVKFCHGKAANRSARSGRPAASRIRGDNPKIDSTVATIDE